jgi:hypothetical protein
MAVLELLGSFIHIKSVSRTGFVLLYETRSMYENRQGQTPLTLGSILPFRE